MRHGRPGRAGVAALAMAMAMVAGAAGAARGEREATRGGERARSVETAALRFESAFERLWGFLFGAFLDARGTVVPGDGGGDGGQSVAPTDEPGGIE